MHVAGNFVGYHFVERTPFSAEADFHTILADSKNCCLQAAGCKTQHTWSHTAVTQLPSFSRVLYFFQCSETFSNAPSRSTFIELVTAKTENETETLNTTVNNFYALSASMKRFKKSYASGHLYVMEMDRLTKD